MSVLLPLLLIVVAAWWVFQSAAHRKYLREIRRLPSGRRPKRMRLLVRQEVHAVPGTRGFVAARSVFTAQLFSGLGDEPEITAVLTQPTRFPGDWAECTKSGIPVNVFEDRAHSLLVIRTSEGIDLWPASRKALTYRVRAPLTGTGKSARRQ